MKKQVRNKIKFQTRTKAAIETEKTKEGILSAKKDKRRVKEQKRLGKEKRNYLKKTQQKDLLRNREKILKVLKKVA